MINFLKGLGFFLIGVILTWDVLYLSVPGVKNWTDDLLNWNETKIEEVVKDETTSEDNENLENEGTGENTDGENTTPEDNTNEGTGQDEILDSGDNTPLCASLYNYSNNTIYLNI